MYFTLTLLVIMSKLIDLLLDADVLCSLLSILLLIITLYIKSHALVNPRLLRRLGRGRVVAGGLRADVVSLLSDC